MILKLKLYNGTQSARVMRLESVEANGPHSNLTMPNKPCYTPLVQHISEVRAKMMENKLEMIKDVVRKHKMAF